MTRTPTFAVATLLAVVALLSAAPAPARGADSPCPQRDSIQWKSWQACNQSCIEAHGLRGDPSGQCEDACDAGVPGFLPDIVAACAVCRAKRAGGDEATCVKKLLDDAKKKLK